MPLAAADALNGPAILLPAENGDCKTPLIADRGVLPVEVAETGLPKAGAPGVWTLKSGDRCFAEPAVGTRVAAGGGFISVGDAKGASAITMSPDPPRPGDVDVLVGPTESLPKDSDPIDGCCSSTDGSIFTAALDVSLVAACVDSCCLSPFSCELCRFLRSRLDRDTNFRLGWVLALYHSPTMASVWMAASR